METKEFIKLLEKTLPELFPAWSSLPAGAGQPELDEIENLTGLAMPPELKFFLSVCDGAGEGVQLRDRLCLLSAAEIIHWWTIHVNVLQWIPDENLDDDEAIVHRDPEVHPRVASRNWLPVAEEADGNISVYIDYDPAPSGQKGQIIWVYPEATEWRLIGHSIGEFWDWIAEDLER